MLRRLDEFLSERLSPRVAGIVAIAWMVCGAVIEACLPDSVIVPIGFAVPVAFCAWVRNQKFLWLLTTSAIVLTFGTIVWRDLPSVDEPVNAVINRVFVAVVLVVVAIVVDLRNIAEARLDVERQSVQKQNAELEVINSELEQREEEIVRQNEELQSQTEELERQSEELRLTNEELAHWEKMLEQLLELSRSLTAELSRSETLDKICETLGLLMGENSSAVLEKRGDEVNLLCHHGFGPDGAAADSIPYASSFASLVMSLGQTGYLEDVSLRPDLVIPQPKRGAEHRAVLSSPVRMHGRCVGTIEAYASTPRIWTESQIAMIESMAAQTSISLQSASLVDAIREERERFEAAFRTLPIGMMVAEDQEGRKVRLNPTAAAMFNLPVNENVSVATQAGRRLVRSMFQAGQQVLEHDLPLCHALNGQEVHAQEFELVLPDGKHLYLLASAGPFFDSHDQIIGAVAAYIDITPHKTLQRELEMRRREAEEASSRKTRFLAAVSHDIRTPANAINLLAELIARSAGHPQLAIQVPELATKLQTNTKSLMDLVGDLLDIARFDSGKVELIESEFSLADLIADECTHLLPLAQAKGLELSHIPPKWPIWLRTDRVKLARVLGNIVGNAIKFTDAGSIRVEASMSAKDRTVLIQVTDTGIGIGAGDVDRIFDEFAQLRNPERDRAKGSGLGLAICKRLVEAMSGSISVQSAQGEGTTFTVTLPPSSVALRLDITLRQPPKPKQEQKSQVDPLQLRVLLVEDHHPSREGTRRILVEEGATVLEAGDGATALKLLNEEKPEAVLLDMMLPDLDGREVLRTIQASRPPQLKCVLVLTGDLTRERVEEIKELGADGLIPKPVDIHKIVTALRSCVTSSNVGESK